METYESLKFYIDTDFDDVRKKIIAMLAGEPVEINPRTFQNDMKNSDDVLTLLINLGYLAYNNSEGYADSVFFPKKNSRKPALLIELEWNHSSGGAIEQIKEKGYCDAILNYGGDILLVGINYDEKEKVHTCQIEKFEYNHS